MLYGFVGALGFLGLLHISLNWRLFPGRFRAPTGTAIASPTHEKLLQVLRVFIAVGYITLMWWCLTRFIALRQSIKTRAGTSSQDYVWSFGQVLGLASWVPVLVELAYVWWEGPEATIAPPVAELRALTTRTDVAMMEPRRAEDIEM